MKTKAEFLNEMKSKFYMFEVTESVWKDIIPENEQIIDYYRQHRAINPDKTIVEKWVILTEKSLLEVTISNKYINSTTTKLEIFQIQKTYKIFNDLEYLTELSTIDIELQNGKRIVLSKATQKEDLDDFFRFIRNFS
jgi:hypothetical protein